MIIPITHFVLHTSETHPDSMIQNKMLLLAIITWIEDLNILTSGKLNDLKALLMRIHVGRPYISEDYFIIGATKYQENPYYYFETKDISSI
jgi:hypothetical protein